MQCVRSIHWFRLIVSIFVLSLLAGCGNGDGESSVSDPIVTGKLLNSPISGVTYRTSSGVVGLTDSVGNFEYRVGEQVTFSIGGIVLGTVSGDDFITPVQLTGSSDATDQATINMLVFLQSIDSNQDPSDGITISNAVRNIAAGLELDFNDPDFSTEALAAVSAMTGGTVTALLSENQALANFARTFIAFGGSEVLGIDFSGDELLVNGGFELPAGGAACPSGWECINFTESRAVDFARTGNHVARLTFFDGIALQNVSARPGNSYEASVWARNDSSEPLNNRVLMELRFFDAGDTQIDVQQVVAVPANAGANEVLLPSNTWVELSASAIAPEGTSRAQLFLIHLAAGDDGGNNVTGGSEGALFVDDASLTELSAEPGCDGINPCGIYSETHTGTTIANSAIVSEGNTVGIDAESTAVTPLDGSEVLELMYSDNTEGNFFGGAVFQFSNQDVTSYNTLKFSIDTSAFTNFANLTIQLEPPGGGANGTFVFLSNYSPAATSGNWNSYEIPLTDFPSTSLTEVNKLGFFNARDGADALLAGTLYLDDIHFLTVTGGGGGGADPGTTPEFVLFGTSAMADVAVPDFVQDVSGPQNFGSNASFDFNFTDTSFDPVIAVTAGDGYGGSPTWVGFLAVVGYASPIATGYDTFNVKVKDSPLGNVEIKLIGKAKANPDDPATDSVFLVDNLDTYAGSTDLGDGWYQLSIPLADFSNPANVADHTGWLVGPPGDQADEAFVFLLTDVGFSNTGGGGGGGADPGTTPEFVLFGTSAMADVAVPDFVQDVSGPQNFGSNASFDFNFTDTSFDPVIAVTAGDGYGGSPTWVGFLAVVGYASQIATGYDTFNVKVKDSPLGNVEIKLIGKAKANPDDPATDSVFLVDNLDTYAGSTDLGDGWYQLSIPLADFSNPANVADHTGWLVGPPGDQADEAFVFLLTDVGFSNTGGGGGGGATNLLSNSGFEAGDTSGWNVLDVGASTGASGTVTSAFSNEGSNSLRIQAGTDQALLLEQVTVGAGTVSDGDTINISYFLRGDFADGGEVQNSLAWASGTTGVIAPNISTSQADWTEFTYTPTVSGGDLTNGFNFQIKVVCGGAATCSADVYIDNISVTIQ